MSNKFNNQLRNFILRNFILATKDANGPICISSHRFQEIISTIEDLCAISVSAMGIDLAGWTYGEIMDLVHAIKLQSADSIPDCIQLHLHDPGVQQQFKHIWDAMDILTRNHLWMPHKPRQTIVIQSDQIQLHRNARTSFTPTVEIKQRSTVPPTDTPNTNSKPQSTHDCSVPDIPRRSLNNVAPLSSNNLPYMSLDNIPCVSLNNVPYMSSSNNVSDTVLPPNNFPSQHKHNIHTFREQPFLNRKGRRAVRREKRDSESQPARSLNEPQDTRDNLQTSQEISPSLNTLSHDVTVLQHRLSYILNDSELTLQFYHVLLKNKIAKSVLTAVMQIPADKSIESSRLIKSSNRSIESSNRVILDSAIEGSDNTIAQLAVWEGQNEKEVELAAKQLGQAHAQTHNNMSKMATETSKSMLSCSRVPSNV